jgi:hypothetical protein
MNARASFDVSSCGKFLIQFGKERAPNMIFFTFSTHELKGWNYVAKAYIAFNKEDSRFV